MPPGKKTLKSKLTQNTGPLKKPIQAKKTEKRQRNYPLEEEEDIMSMSKLIGQYQASVKKMKVDPKTEAADTRKKIVDLCSEQHQARKQYNDNIFENLAEINAQVEADFNVMKENEQKLEKLANSFMKCVQQTTVACKQRLKALKEIKSYFQKQYDDMESEHKEEIEKLMDKLDNDIKKLEEKFYKESKRKSWDDLRRNIFHAIQNDC